MKYHIDTIPVWDALNENSECLICSIEDKLEQKYVDFYLGDSVMQPDIRQNINKTGFCHKHYQMMNNRTKKLPLGLACYTRIEYLRENLDKYFDIMTSEEKALKKTRAIECVKYIKGITSTCAVCDNVEENIKRYLYTFIHLWKTDKEFADNFMESKGLCLQHFAQLIEFSKKEFNDKITLGLTKDLAQVQKKNLQRLSEEVKYFNDKFDHRNVDKPWGTAKDAIPRVINKLSGHKIKT